MGNVKLPTHRGLKSFAKYDNLQRAVMIFAKQHLNLIKKRKPIKNEAGSVPFVSFGVVEKNK